MGQWLDYHAIPRSGIHRIVQKDRLFQTLPGKYLVNVAARLIEPRN
jgi:hypothetical protein